MCGHPYLMHGSRRRCVGLTSPLFILPAASGHERLLYRRQPTRRPRGEVSCMEPVIVLLGCSVQSERGRGLSPLSSNTAGQ